MREGAPNGNSGSENEDAVANEIAAATVKKMLDAEALRLDARSPSQSLANEVPTGNNDISDAPEANETKPTYTLPGVGEVVVDDDDGEDAIVVTVTRPDGSTVTQTLNRDEMNLLEDTYGGKPEPAAEDIVDPKKDSVEEPDKPVDAPEQIIQWTDIDNPPKVDMPVVPASMPVPIPQAATTNPSTPPKPAAVPIPATPKPEGINTVLNRLEVNLGLKPDNKKPAKADSLTPERRAELEQLVAEGEEAKQKLDGKAGEKEQKSLDSLSKMQKELSDRLERAPASEKAKIQEQIDALDMAISWQAAKSSDKALTDTRRAELEKLAKEGRDAEAKLGGKGKLSPEREAELKDLVKDGESASEELNTNGNKLTKQRRAALEALVAEGRAASEEIKAAKESSKKDKEKNEAEKAQERKEQFDSTRKEILDKYKSDYEAKVKELSEVNARLTTHWFGRRKNEQRAKELSAEIAAIDQQVSKEFIKAGMESGRYETDVTGSSKKVEAAIRQMKIDDAFDLSVQTAREVFSQTNTRLKERQDNLKWYQKFSAKVGSWINKGSGRNFATGFGVGLVTNGITAFTAAGIPVTSAVLAVAGGAGAAITYFGAREDAIGKMVSEREGADIYSNPALEAIRKAMSDKTDELIGKSGKAKEYAGVTADYTSQLLSGQSRISVESNKNINKQAIKRTRAFLGGLGLGAAAGSFAGSAMHTWLNPPAPTPPPPPPPPPPPGPGVEHLANINTNGAPEHLIRDLLSQSHATGQNPGGLLHELFNQTGGNVFQTSTGQNVAIHNFGGKIGIGFDAWNQNLSVGWSEAAKAILRAKGIPV